MSNKICDGIKARLDDTSLPDLMVATNIFERGFGKSRAKIILKAFPDILTSDLSDEQKLSNVSSLNGFGLKTASLFVPFIPKFLEFIEKTNLQHKLIVEDKPENTSHPLFQKKISMTGFRDKILENEIIEAGGEIINSIAKNTFILIVDSLDSDSGKAVKARKFKIPMMTPYAFSNKFFS